MKPDEELERLLDGDTVPSELRRGLESAAGARPSAEQLARMATRLGIGVIPVPPSGSGTAPGGAASPALKLALGSGLAIAVVAGIGLLRKPDAPPAPNAASVQLAAKPSADPPVEPNAVAPVAPNKGRSSEQIKKTIEPPPAEPPPAMAEEPAAPLPAVPVGVAPPAPAVKEAAPAKPETAVPRAPVSEAPARSTPSRTSSDHTPATTDLPDAPPAAPVSETQLLRDARLALGSDPGRALALAERHLREYPSGSFGQEREYIAINALFQLGRTSEARARAERFRTSYPRSPYVGRLDRLMGR